jgi:hypothetical protein
MLHNRGLYTPPGIPIGLLGLLGLSSDYSWLRGLLNIQCESEPVRTESEQSPSDYSESSDSLRTDSERSLTRSDLALESDSTGYLLEFKKYLLL